MVRKLCSFVLLMLLLLISVNAYAHSHVHPTHGYRRYHHVLHHRSSTIHRHWVRYRRRHRFHTSRISRNEVKHSRHIRHLYRHTQRHSAVYAYHRPHRMRHRLSRRKVHWSRHYRPIQHLAYTVSFHPSVHVGPVLNEMERQTHCMAQAIYHEARAEPPQGQAAVGYVVMNRLRDIRFPSTVCGVVYQRSRTRSGRVLCQFSWACHGGTSINRIQMAQALRIARAVMAQELPNLAGDALFFHASYLAYRPRSAPYHRTIGRQIFYGPHPIHIVPPTEMAYVASTHSS